MITQVHPQPLPNLYKGQHLILSGRFTEPVATTMTLSGWAFNTPVQYHYPVNLADTAVTQFSFLPKIWAKIKIENLTTNYYISSDTNLLHMIEDISTCHGVLSQFTSFQIDDGGNPVSVEESGTFAEAKPIIASPNPFRDRVLFHLHRPIAGADGAFVYIYDAYGRLVHRLYLAGCPIEFGWDGRDASGYPVPAGIYTVVISDAAGVQRGKIVKI